MGNPLAAVLVSLPVSKRASYCKCRVPNCFTNAIGPHAAISRDKSPMSNRMLTCAAASGMSVRLLSSPNRSREKSNSNLSNKTPSRLAVPAEEAHEAGA